MHFKSFQIFILCFGSILNYNFKVFLARMFCDSVCGILQFISFTKVFFLSSFCLSVQEIYLGIRNDHFQTVEQYTYCISDLPYEGKCLFLEMTRNHCLLCTFIVKKF